MKRFLTLLSAAILPVLPVQAIAAEITAEPASYELSPNFTRGSPDSTTNYNPFFDNGIYAGEVFHPEQYIEVKELKVEIVARTNRTCLVRWWAEPPFKYMLEVRRDAGTEPFQSPGPVHEPYRWVSLPGWMYETVYEAAPSQVIRLKRMPNEGYLSGFGYPPELLEILANQQKWMSLVWATKMERLWSRLFITPWGITGPDGYLIPYFQFPTVPPTYGGSGVPAGLTVSGGLNNIIDDASDSSYRDVFASLGPRDPPRYRSTGIETNRWSGTIITAPDQPLWVYIRSDDGSKVTVNDVVELDLFATTTTWPSLSSCFAFVCCLRAGTTNRVVVDYSNMQFTGGADVDGVTLFLIGDNARDGRIVGDYDLDWYGSDGAEPQTYFYDGHETALNWQVSSNLVIDNVDQGLKSITVHPIGESTVEGGDWIRVSGTKPCGGTSPAVAAAVTVYAPTFALTQSISNSLDHAGDTVTLVIYVIMDQFARPFPFTCYVSEQTWAFGMEGPTQGIAPDVHNYRPRLGVFPDTLSVTRSITGDFFRGQRLWVHRTFDSRGGRNVRYNRLHFHPPMIDVEPIGMPVP